MQLALTRTRWSVVAAVAILAAFAIAAGGLWQVHGRPEKTPAAMTGGDMDRAPELIRRYGCAGCHTIPGIRGGDGQVGGPLSDIKHRVYVGGVLTNSPDNLV